MKKTNVPVVTLAIFMTTFMTAIEGTIVSTAMPTIVSDLDGLEIMNWVVSIFLLMTAVSTPLYGKLADSIGRILGKVVFFCGDMLMECLRRHLLEAGGFLDRGHAERSKEAVLRGCDSRRCVLDGRSCD